MTQLTERTTIPQLLRNVVKYIHAAESPFMYERGKTSYEPISYKTTLDYADAISAYLLDHGIKKGDRAALITDNCPEYIYYDQGLQQIGAVNVSIYPTLSEHDIQYILNDAGARVILVGNPFLLRKILKIAPECPALSLIIPAFDEFEKVVQAENNAVLAGFKQVLEEGRFKYSSYKELIERARNEVLPDDLSSLIYTSGTTGTPKGVMLTHANFVSNVKACLEQIPVINNEEVFLSFLPLSHVFERTATYHVCCAKGCKIAFAESLEALARNMTEARPTIMAAVPRLLEKIYDKAMKSGTSAGGLKAKIFLWAIATGETVRKTKEHGNMLSPVLALKFKLADKLVFSKIREKTGGRIKFILSGGAALPQNVGEFFGNLNIKVLEGFGLTETSPVMAVTEFHRQIYGTVGRIIPGVTVAIQDPDTKKILAKQTHDSFDPAFESEEGEIIVKGHCVMKGYWNKPEDTAQVIDSEGWFHTGDVGKFYKGNLKITDRIKNMLVNSYGKNVYPTPVENTYLKSSKIEQVFLLGDKREYIAAIIVPSRESLTEAFKLDESFFNDPDPFIRDRKIIDWIREDIKLLSEELAKFERIRNFILKRNPFTIETGELTPTMKAKRRVIEQQYAKEIAELYEENAE